MKKISNIFYTDATYWYADELKKKHITVEDVKQHAKLPVFEAYGFLEKYKDNLIISFVRTFHSGKQEKNNDSRLAFGVIIPETALISRQGENDYISKNIKRGMQCAIYWKDTLVVSDGTYRECPVMYTEGLIVAIKKGRILLGNPETIRVKHLPPKNHPQKKADFYQIPLSLVMSIEKIPVKRKHEEKNKKSNSK